MLPILKIRLFLTYLDRNVRLYYWVKPQLYVRSYPLLGILSLNSVLRFFLKLLLFPKLVSFLNILFRYVCGLHCVSKSIILFNILNFSFPKILPFYISFSDEISSSWSIRSQLLIFSRFLSISSTTVINTSK